MAEETQGSYADAEAAATEQLMADIEGSPEPQAAQPQATEATPEPDQPQPQAEESFTGLDPSTLSGPALEAYKSMQADYTRKTQEIAAYRELGYDPATLQQAVDFTSRLTSDPNYAAEVVEELYDLVLQAGIDPFDGKLDKDLGEDFGNPDGAIPDGFDSYESDEGTLDPALQNQLSALTNELSALKQAEQARQEALEEQELQLYLDRQEQEIRSQNPSYSEADIDMIHRIGWSTEGNLLEAAEIYRESMQRNASAYLDAKGKSEAQPGLPSTGQHSEAPQTFDNLNDPALDELALLRLQQALEAE